MEDRVLVFLTIILRSAEACLEPDRAQSRGEIRAFARDARERRADQKERELVAANASDCVHLARLGAEQLAHTAQRVIAMRVAKEIVQLLEAVEIAQDDDSARPAAPRRSVGAEERVDEAAPVEEAGQLVGRHLALEIGDARFE